MPTHDIESILQDLYAADPGLKSDEPRLRALIAELLEARPDTRFDETFASELRAKLAAAPRKISFFKAIMNLKSPLLPAGAIAIVAVVALVATQQPGLKPGTTSELAGISGVRIEAAGKNAFGSLVALDVGDAAMGVGLRSQAGGGMGLAAPSTPPITADATAENTGLMQESAVAAEGDAKRIASPLIWPGPELVNYRFVYKGELPALDAQQTVYKRVKGEGLPADAVRNLGLGVMDLGRFSSAKLQSFNLVEDRDYGYMIYVDGVESTISISQNWMKWPNPGADCRDEACYQSLRLNPEDVPADEEVIAIAERFLADYGISKSDYGAPIVRSEWRGQYARATDKASFWIPDSVAVVYPLTLDGREVNDEGGYASGLTVNVNVRHKRVDGVWNLVSNRYRSSLYDIETDAAKILAAAERGGQYGWFDPTAKNTVDVELGAPSLVLTKVWLPRPSGPADELLVPALRFPVLNPPADQSWFRDNVTVPLAKELLGQAQPPIMLMEKSVR